MLHPHTEWRFINPQVGYGVVATRFIPRGTIIWALDDVDRAFSQAEVAHMARFYRAIIAKYAYVGASGAYILCWDLARYINHSCRPTCLSTGYEFELAARDIMPGEELTDDYGSLNLTEASECHCGHAECRRIIQPDDYLRYADAWDAAILPSCRAQFYVWQPAHKRSTGGMALHANGYICNASSLNPRPGVR
jgi:hypothetical protein